MMTIMKLVMIYEKRLPGVETPFPSPYLLVLFALPHLCLIPQVGSFAFYNISLAVVFLIAISYTF
ncbi:hypothetical protein K435DRAFT_781567 [Dendrothele bispora CBS 962.96]|uniref:Uncharacterized protein n=1 Tax=Dendrothele bispora (strain CBS 962.96) TaxID=1314807 RepID=A0A4S8LKP0_DENBC|nr:hypothetical protein K435DRAFT_781567 [Dendrothele bispora CBS 962.96]